MGPIEKVSIRLYTAVPAGTYPSMSKIPCVCIRVPHRVRQDIFGNKWNKNSPGRRSWRVLPRFGNLSKMKFSKGGRGKDMTWTCVWFFTIFYDKVRASCGRPQCVLQPFAGTCSSSSSVPITYSPTSPLSKPPLRSRLRFCFFFCPAW